MFYSSQEAVETACEAFPVLQGFASERIIFSIDSELSLVGRARILKASWIGMRSKPPKNIFVGIEDGPGDAALRECLPPPNHPTHPRSPHADRLLLTILQERNGRQGPNTRRQVLRSL